jgi:hypothetical protein
LNVHKAADHLFLTQPAVTLQIKALEQDLGVRLFDRAAGRISLTRQGSILLSYASKMAALEAEAEQQLGCKDGKVSGAVTGGIYDPGSWPKACSSTSSASSLRPARWIMGGLDWPMKPIDFVPKPHPANVDVHDIPKGKELSAMPEAGEIDGAKSTGC